MSSDIPKFIKYLYLLIGLWTLCFVAVWLMIYSNWKEEFHKHVALKAQTVLNKDLSFRTWAAMHGGVYIPPTDKTPPNPYLDFLSDRDIVTTEGKSLTLMNPAYMIRQVMQEFESTYDIKGHITSLKPINPANAADEWETTALKRFETDMDSVDIFLRSEGELIYRKMIPLITKKGCLKCHARQGYKEGDIRGGLSVTFPVTQLYALGKNNIIKETIILFGLYLLGLVGLVVTTRKNIRDSEEIIMQQRRHIESQRRFDDVARSTGEWIWEVDTQGKYTYASPAVEGILGYTPEEILDKHFYDLFHLDDREGVKDAAFKVFSRKESFSNFQNRNVHKDGHEVILETNGVPVLDNNGELLGYRGADRDITARREAEEILKESEKKHRDLVETAQDLIWKCDNKGRFTYLNPAWEEVLGYKTSEMLGKSFGDFQPPEIFERDIKEFAHHMKGGFVKGYETIHIAKSGQEKTLLFNAIPLVDAEGNIIGTQGTATDITERKKMEDALRLSEASLKKTQEIGHIGSWHLDIEKNVLTWSDEEYRIFGHTPQTFGSTYEAFLEAVHPDDREMVNKTYTDAITNNTPYECVHKVLRPDGEIRTVLERSEDIVDEKGKTIHSIGMTLDITEQKSHEEKIQNSLKEKNVLLKEIHHRVKNNMAVISSLLSLQSGYIVDEKYLDMFKESQNRIMSMALVHEKLYQSEDFAHIDVSDYVRSLVGNVQSTFAGNIPVGSSVKVGSIDLDIDTLVPCGLIINELLTNAMKHAFEGIGKPEIRVEMTQTDDNNVALTISDNGNGLPAEFDIQQSTGLGLKLVGTLVNQIYGSIEAISEHGTTFKLTFPNKA